MIEISQNISSYISALYGTATAQRYAEFAKLEHTSYLRILNNSVPVSAITEKLTSYGIKTEQVPGIPFAYKILSGDGLAGKTLEYSLGQYYIQSLSSMIPPLILDPKENEKVLDLCAAPGSKATELSALMNGKGTLVANEISLDRIKMLVYNIDRMNAANAGVINFKGEWLAGVFNEYFDKILVDAPCSALGVLQKKEEVSNWWNEERMSKIAAMQMAIITSALKMVKVGGEIVYSTCTMTVEENEMIINHILNKYPVETVDISLPVISSNSFTSYKDKVFHSGISKTQRILPWEDDSEGFFVAKLRKTDSLAVSKPATKTPAPLKFIRHDSREAKDNISSIASEFQIDRSEFENYKFLLKGGDLYFIDEEWDGGNTGYYQRIGLHFATIDKTGKWRIHSSAAQHFGANAQSKVYEIKSDEELRIYLQGGIIRTSEAAGGQYIIKFKGQILGTSASVNGGLKSQLPKSRRVNEVKIY
jgi:16S rRNA (cytosine1407-C5)-methyltransferase